MNAMGNDRMRDEHNDRTMVERIDPLMGTVLGRYRIDFRLAAGGFGAIYRATHVETGGQYAMKVLHAELATSDAKVIVRFRREHSTLSQLRNPNTIQAYEFGEAPDGSLYFAMELLHGESLYEQFRAKGPLPWDRVASIGRQVCNSLAEAHSLGIIHRDLKPANIHLEPRDGNPDFVKVLDFGIAKLIRENADVKISELDATELTQAGQMIGTFDYMAPEQMVGGQCTGKTDIYTLGIVLYEMLSGRRPFADAASPTAMLAALLTQTPPPLGVRGVPSELERIVFKCLEREQHNRYDDVAELAADLDRLLVSAREGVTRKTHTPPPVIMDSEATVVAQPRAKRGTPPHPNVTADQRPRRGSEPPPNRPKRDSAPPSPNVIRREGSSPAIPVNLIGGAASGEARPKRDSQPAPYVVRRDQPQPQPADPGAWQSLQLPKPNPGRDSQPIARYDGRDSQPVPVFRDERDGSAPVKAQRKSDPAPLLTPQPPHPQHPPPAAYPAASYPAPENPYPAYPGYPNQQQFTPAPMPYTPAPIPVTPPPPHMITPHQHTPAPQLDPRASLAAIAARSIDPNAWRNTTPPLGSRPEVRGYDMAGSQSRDVVVRRVVWAIALVLGVILALVVASRL